MLYSSEAAALCLRSLTESRVPREVVIYFGQRHQCYDVGALNGDTPSDVLEADVARERFVDSLEMQGEGPDEVFSGLGPVRSGYGCDEGIRYDFSEDTNSGCLWYSERVPCLFSGSTNDRAANASNMVVAPTVRGFGAIVDLLASYTIPNK